MSSSDSEDDSFFNIAQKLSALKNNFHVTDNEPVKEPESIPAASTSLSKRQNNKNKSPATSKRRRSSDSASSGSIDLDDFRKKFPPINKPTPKTRRGRKKKGADSPNLADSQMCLSSRRKKSAANEIAGNCSDEQMNEVMTRNRGRGRGRARGRGRGRNRRSTYEGPSLLEVLQAFIPTISVGNTEEYPDQCDNQELFGQKNNVVEIDLEESLEDNEELSVKVCWQSLDIFKFMIRKYQKFTVLYEFFAKKENVSQDKLLFMYEDKILRPEDTPDAINYSIVKFIDGGIVKQSVALPLDPRQKDGVKLKFQCQNLKKPFEIFIKPDDKLSIAMMNCAEQLEKPLDKLRFEFDGDIISGKSTPRELELEGGECIDVKILI